MAAIDTDKKAWASLSKLHRLFRKRNIGAAIKRVAVIIFEFYVLSYCPHHSDFFIIHRSLDNLNIFLKKSAIILLQLIPYWLQFATSLTFGNTCLIAAQCITLYIRIISDISR